MKFEIVRKKFKDKTIEALVIKMFEYFAAINAQREESAKKSKNKQDMFDLLDDLCEYVESGLKKKFSENFVVFMNDSPNYAVKYDQNYFLALKYLSYNIIIIKIPYICVPGTFRKNLTEEEIKKEEEFYTENKENIVTNNIKRIDYVYTLTSGKNKSKNSEKFTEEYFRDLIARNISYYAVKCAEEKKIQNLPLAIQHDISKFDDDYNWNVIVSRKQIYTDSFLRSCQSAYHCKIKDENKEFNVRGLRDLEILIYKRNAIFESVLKNILS